MGIGLHVDTTRVLFACFPSPIGVSGGKPDFDVKPPLWTPHLIFPRGYLLKSFPRGVLPQDNGGLKSVFSLS